MRFMILVAIWVCALLGAAVLLSGCETAKYAECLARDNTRNPCN